MRRIELSTGAYRLAQGSFLLQILRSTKMAEVFSMILESENQGTIQAFEVAQSLDHFQNIHEYP